MGRGLVLAWPISGPGLIPFPVESVKGLLSSGCAWNSAKTQSLTNDCGPLPFMPSRLGRDPLRCILGAEPDVGVPRPQTLRLCPELPGTVSRVKTLPRQSCLRPASVTCLVLSPMPAGCSPLQGGSEEGAVSILPPPGPLLPLFPSHKPPPRSPSSQISAPGNLQALRLQLVPPVADAGGHRHATAFCPFPVAARPLADRLAQCRVPNPCPCICSLLQLVISGPVQQAPHAALPPGFYPHIHTPPLGYGAVPAHPAAHPALPTHPGHTFISGMTFPFRPIR